MNFHCPTCARKKDVIAKCRLEAETKARKEAELRAQERMEKEKEERGQADEMAGAVFEFFASLIPEVMAEISELPANLQEDDAETLAEMLVPSPDSITVTTVFGVHEEPSNVTVITASAPPPTVTANEELALQGTLEDLNENMEQLQVAEHTLVAAVGGHVALDGEHDDIMEDDGDDADIDTDDFDAESALIDEFIDNGALTPTTTTTTGIL